MDPRSVVYHLLRRQDDAADDDDPGQKVLKLFKDPFHAQLSANSLYSALGTSLAFTFFIALLFSLLRPYNQSIYAPKLKHADERHAPPPIGKEPWSWITALWQTKEEHLIQQVGMDATVFLRFCRMCRNMFLVLSIVGVGILIPVYSSKKGSYADSNWVNSITPMTVWGSAIWAQVVVAWLFNIIVAGFLWWNYRKIHQLRRKYFEGEEFQNSLFSRTLMLFDIPKKGRSDEGIARIIDEVVPNASFARTAVARNVKELPQLIEQHANAVRKLEKYLAKYLKNPSQLPAARPTCKPSKKDRSYDTYPKNQKVDAIEYYTQRIKDLEIEIKEVRASVDKRGSMPYGFASYSDITEAHNIAYACRKKRPVGTTIKLAPRPNDIIWNNMHLSSASRSRKRWVNNFWILLLTLIWIAPNAGIAVFLVNLSNLGSVWPAFQKSLESDTKFWGIAQGIISPLIMSLVYLVLPIIFRRLANKSGDQTKTARERHVLAKLYAFFVFNNLIVFSIFSACWGFVATVVDDTNKGTNAWEAIIKANLANSVFTILCTNSPFWVTYLLQRQLGAAIDLAQLWPLVQAFFLKKFSSPTPRELIELTAPPPFDYASYYNYFLYYATVTLCFAGIQPLVLPATALYFCIDAYLKKYLILYRFVTKTESGGMFWRVLFNRFIFGTMLSDLMVLLTCWVRGEGSHIQFYAVAPLPFLMFAFKFYCSSAFDNKIQYYSTRNVMKNPEGGLQKENQKRSERLASRFGHPALYKPLITPMVHSKAQNLLPSVYKGRLTDGREANAGDTMTVSGYSDMYALDAMQGGRPGKSASNVPGFEYVSESQMDFEFYKNRAEFAEEHGGGEIFGTPGEIGRPGTPSSWAGSENGSRPGTPVSGRSTPFKPNSQRMLSKSETSYQAYRPGGQSSYSGFTQQPTMGTEPGRGRSPLYAHDNNSSSGLGLVHNAAAPPMSTPMNASGRSTPGVTPPVNTPGPSLGALGGGPRGYSGLAQSEVDNDPAPAQYDYFRSGSRTRRNPGEGW
ncbi:Fc.00g071840.m01.CDS01 [Cosmosporella sp. VM-42]